MRIPDPTWRTVEVDGAAVEVLSAGTGDPLLFLHGWGLTPRAYLAGLLRLCAAGVQVVAPSLPGHGGSAAPRRPNDLSSYAERIGDLLDTLDLRRPVFVVGHSFGGGVALRLASTRPEHVRSLTLVNSVGGGPGAGGMTSRSWLRWAVAALPELNPAGMLGLVPTIARDFVPALVRHPLTVALSGLTAVGASLADEAHALVDAGLPVLFLWSDADRVIAPGTLAGVAGDRAAHLVTGRHAWPLTAPEDFAVQLREALVVHALGERERRGLSLHLPEGASLADLFPPERRRRARPSQGGRG